MKVVIQCAAQKDSDAGYWPTDGGKAVSFVASPAEATPSGKIIYARPDDASDQGVSWRSLVWDYNKAPGRNPLNLYPAYQLYRNDTYRALAKQFGIENTFILSAGWGLIRSDFLTPQYDITFSAAAFIANRRRKTDHYSDFCMLPNDGTEVVFFGGKDYLPLFLSLTGAFKGQRNVFYNSASCPNLPGCTVTRYKTATRTNWHYECAKAFIAEAD